MDDLEAVDDVEDAREFLSTVIEGPRFCGWCLTPVRKAYPEYDQAEAEQLSIGDTKQTFEAKGHRIAEDGTVDATTATLIPTSESYVEYVFSGKTVFCSECARADGAAPWENRSKRQRHIHFENLATGLDTDLDRDAAHDAISEANKDCDLDDLDALARGLLAALPPQ